jgi:hypothetical protein
MKRANHLIRKADREGLADLGFSEETITKLFAQDFAGRAGSHNYVLAKRLEKRLAVIQNAQHDETTEEQFPGGVRLPYNSAENRDPMLSALGLGSRIAWLPLSGRYRPKKNATRFPELVRYATTESRLTAMQEHRTTWWNSTVIMSPLAGGIPSFPQIAIAWPSRRDPPLLANLLATRSLEFNSLVCCTITEPESVVSGTLWPNCTDSN